MILLRAWTVIAVIAGVFVAGPSASAASHLAARADPSPASTPIPIPAPAPNTSTALTAPALARPGNPVADAIHTRTFRIDTGVTVAVLFVLLSLIQFLRWRRFRVSP